MASRQLVSPKTNSTLTLLVVAGLLAWFAISSAGGGGFLCGARAGNAHAAEVRADGSSIGDLGELAGGLIERERNGRDC